jgi:hypothetical protein
VCVGRVPQGFLRPIETGFAAMVRLRPLRQQDEDPNLSGAPSGHGLMDGPGFLPPFFVHARNGGFSIRHELGAIQPAA